MAEHLTVLAAQPRLHNCWLFERPQVDPSAHDLVRQVIDQEEQTGGKAGCLQPTLKDPLGDAKRFC